jgi:hypothetical protein
MHTTKPTRLRQASLLALVGATALVLGCADAVGYAATGESLVLGHSNTSSTTTKLQSTGSGAALRLVSRKGQPGLSVSNSQKVEKLNADKVDGRGAGSLDPAITIFPTGADNTPLPLQAIYSTPLRAGTYELSINGYFQSTDPNGVICVAGDSTAANENPLVSYEKVYLFDFVTTGDGGPFAAVAQSNVVRVPHDITLIYGCLVVGGPSQVVQLDAAELTVRKVNTVKSGTGTGFTLPQRTVNRLRAFR